MEHVIRDLRFAARSLLRSRRFTVPAVLTLALGIATTSAMFSVMRGVILRPLPYANPDRIVVVWESSARRSRNVIASSNFVEWQLRNRSFSDLGMVGPARLNLVFDGRPEEAIGKFASSDVFRVVGVHPAVGRAYGPSEDVEGNDRVIIVSDNFWRTRLGGRADAIGGTITTNGIPRTLVGVMPPGFTMLGDRTDFLIPYGMTTAQMRSAPGRGSSYGLARLRDGVSFEQASSDMKAIAAQLEQEFPQRNARWSVALVPVHEQMVDQIRPALRVLAGAALLVLLVSCVNVANLLLARNAVRQSEIGLRTALGARRVRLISQMVGESMLLGACGGVAGLLLAFLFHRGLLALVAESLPIPRLDQVSLDLPVVTLTMGLSLVTGLLFGIVPAIVSSHAANDAVRHGGRHGGGPRAHRVLSTLVAAEVALSLVLLTGAGLLVRSFIRLSSIDPGFRAEGLFTARVQNPGARYGTPERSSRFYSDFLARISALPGVQSAAGVTFLPMASGGGIGTSFWRTDQPAPGPGQAPSTDVRPVTPGFFRTMGIPHVMGRDFAASDRGNSPLVAIVNETLVRQHLPDGNPIGKRLHVNIGRIDRGDYEVVGVVGDITLATLDVAVRPTVYIPHTQLPMGVMTLVARTAMNPSSLARSVAAELHAMDPELPLTEVRTMDEVVAATLVRPRVVAVLLTAFAFMALALAAVGVYGVMAYSVAQRTREIGVRMALGATPQSVFELVLRRALRPVSIGVVAGLAAAAALTRPLAALLYETKALDLPTFIVTAAVLLLVATMASYIPARRGTRIAPVAALRAE